MTIDKQQLQKLLWAEAASYRADCADWKRNTEALDDFLGEKTVGEVALELLSENEALRKDLESHKRMLLSAACGLGAIGEALGAEMDDDASELEGLALELRKNAERYQWLREARSGYIEVVEWIGPHATGMTGEDLDALLDAAMSKGEQS